LKSWRHPNEDEANRAMQKESRQRRITMREIADTIVLRDDMRGIGKAELGIAPKVNE
jgi:AmiR/NasT family two-component response regulator